MLKILAPGTPIEIDRAKHRTTSRRNARIACVRHVAAAPRGRPRSGGDIGILTDEEEDLLVECGRLWIRGHLSDDRPEQSDLTPSS